MVYTCASSSSCRVPCWQGAADMFNFHASAGSAPVQAMLVIAPLIPKPQGGRRPIGIFSAWQRVWGRVQRAIGRAWLRGYAAAHPVVAAGPDRPSLPKGFVR